MLKSHSKISRFLVAVVGALALADGFAQAPARTLNIGVISSASGPMTDNAVPWTIGAQVAATKINQSGGLTVGGQKYMIRLIIKDDRSDPQAAQAAAVQIVEDEGAKFIVGPLISNLAPPVIEYAAKRRVLVVSGASNLDAILTADAVKDRYKTIFKTQIHGDDRGAMMAKAVKGLFPSATRIAVVVPSHATGQTIADSAVAGAKSQGLQLVSNERFAPGTSDFSTVLTKVRQAQPDVLIMCCAPGETTGLVRQGHELGATKGFFGITYPLAIPLKEAIGRPIPEASGHLGFPAFIETLPDGTVFTTGDRLKEYAAEYQRQFGRKPPVNMQNSLFSYDWVGILVKAIEAAGSVDDTIAIANALEMQKYEGVLGQLSFDNTHIARHSAQGCVLQNGKITKCMEVPYERTR